jgi:hypothetical protein
MVQTARAALAAFGEIDRKTARKLLTMWAGYRSLTSLQVSEVLKKFR